MKLKIMKILLICIFLIPLKIISQIPFFNSNAVKEDSLNSIILRPQFDKYDFLISYESNSYWTRYKTNINILANKKNKWFFINIQKTYKKDTVFEIDYEHPIKISQKKRRILKFRIKKVLRIFNENRIWSLNTDSLNINFKSSLGNEEDSIQQVYIVTDCTYYTLKFRTNESFRIVGTYCPYYYLEEIPEIKVRQNFIKCYESINLIGRKFKPLRKARNKWLVKKCEKENLNG
jgi:hypothetical protein